jgi:hypothetical protein
MNIALWVLQVLLALHTVVGAIWKFSNSAQTVPSLTAIPNSAWLALAIIELVCSVGLVLPAVNRSLAIVTPVAATIIAAEMLLFCGVHLASGIADHVRLVYWLVTAALCAVLAFGRFVLRPL